MQNPSLFFNDGTRKIDFILAWDENTPSTTSQNAFIKRSTFESNLEKEGLELERVNTPGVPLHYIKIHAPNEILRRYAEILKLRMPMKMVTTHWSITTVHSAAAVYWPTFSLPFFSDRTRRHWLCWVFQYGISFKGNSITITPTRKV